jgi:C4-dicarboxylate-specific signal transduction histidine kinase
MHSFISIIVNSLLSANWRRWGHQPFFTTKPTGQGTGLGLALSYDIIQKGHGGELKVETKEGAGAEFVIQLPLK